MGVGKALFLAGVLAGGTYLAMQADRIADIVPKVDRIASSGIELAGNIARKGRDEISKFGYKVLNLDGRIGSFSNDDGCTEKHMQYVGNVAKYRVAFDSTHSVIEGLEPFIGHSVDATTGACTMEYGPVIDIP